MRGLPAEAILFIGGGVVTVAVAIFVIIVLVRANRDHDRQIERERRVTRAGDSNSAREGGAGASEVHRSGDANPMATPAPRSDR